MIKASIIMAAYNSEKEIGRALRSIRNQDINHEEIEILVIDGGSNDSTKNIASDYNAVVLDNPERLPEPAKIIGVKYAKGKYIFIMDTDEEFADNSILKKRIELFERHPEVRAYIGGFQTPLFEKKFSCLNYINQVGDPFTCFIYRTYLGGSMYGLVKKRGIYEKKYDSYIAYFSNRDIIPIGDSVTGLDREYIMKNYKKEIYNGITTATLFDLAVRDTGYVAHINNDLDYHYSISSFNSYFKKLKFRVINNIFDVAGSGYSSKAEFNTKLRMRKYLFPLYVFSLVCPIYHGIYMSFAYKDIVFLMHPVFCWYVIFQIFFQYLKKFLGLKSKNKSYAR